MSRILVIDDENLIRRRIANLLEGVGHIVSQAADGQAGLAVVHKFNPDLILVDFVMPKMNGFQFCAALRAIPNHKDTPVLLLSVRSERIGEQFIKHFGVSDAISKPFEEDALLALIQKLLGAKISPAAGPAFAVGALAGAFSLSPVSDSSHPATTVSERIASWLVEEVPSLNDKKSATIQALISKLEAGEPSGLDQLRTDLESGADGPVLSGCLAVFSLGDVLQMLAMLRHSGILEVTTPGAQAAIQLGQGCIEIVVGSGIPHEFLLGRYLVEERIVSKQDLDLLLKARKGPRLLGEQLIKLAYISEEDLTRVLTRQTSDVMIEILKWNEGRFFFRKDVALPDITRTGNRLEVSSVIMEGLRQVDEWRLIEREIPSFDRVFEIPKRRGSLIGIADLSEEETFVLENVDGKKSVRDIIDTTDMGSFITCRILYRLLSIKLIQCLPG